MRVVAGAAAVDAVDAGADLLVGGLRRFVEQRACRHDVARNADAALQRRLVDERLLHRMQRGGAGEAFDGADLGAVAQRGELQARRDRLAVHDHGARAAGADAAAVLGARHVQVFPQHVDQQTVAAFRHDFDRVTVECEFDQHERYVLSCGVLN